MTKNIGMVPESIQSDNKSYDRGNLANHFILGMALGGLIIFSITMVLGYIREYNSTQMAEIQYVQECYNLGGAVVEGRSITNWNYLYCIKNDNLLAPRNSQYGE